MRFSRTATVVCVASLILLAGCSSNLPVEEAEVQSTVVEDVSLTEVDQNVLKLVVTYDEAPEITNQVSQWNPATKTTQYYYYDHAVNVTDARVALKTDGEDTDPVLVSPDSVNESAATFTIHLDGAQEVSIQSHVVDVDDGNEWGWAEFGFTLDYSQSTYIAQNSTHYSETF